MKKLFLATTALIALASGSAVAADMPVKAVYRAPVVVYNWTGCYIGGSVGANWRRSYDPSFSLVDGGSGAAAALAAGAIPPRYSIDGSGWLGGGQIGCNYQASNWVFGIETDISGTRLNGSQTLNTAVAGFFPVTASASQSMNWIGTTRGRIGWAFDNVLVYATGGAAYAKVSNTYGLSNVAGGGNVSTALADSANQFGWTLGAGLEVGFGQWSVKGEYLYYDIGSHTLTGNCTITGGALCAGATPTTFSTQFANRGSIARVGLNYRFGGKGVVAAY
jgi:outer membrane immunogenic protein